MTDVNALTHVGNLVVGVAEGDPRNVGKFDLTHDNSIDGDDLSRWLTDASTKNGWTAPYLLRDTDLNARVVFADFVAQNNYWQRTNTAPDAAPTVPESSSILLAAIGLVAIVLNRVRCCPSVFADGRIFHTTHVQLFVIIRPMKHYQYTAAILVATLCVPVPVIADGPNDNRVDNVRPVPPVGIAVPTDVADRLRHDLRRLDDEISRLQSELRDKPTLLALLPDVAIYAKAVRVALEHQEFFDLREFESAATLLSHASGLANQLANGERLHQENGSDSRHVRIHAYVSRIDGSLQPYRIIVPPGHATSTDRPRRLDFWCHGRGETLSELNFLAQSGMGEFTPPDAFVVHLYGRYCNANKFAGEIDLLEVLDDVKRRYHIDEDRIVIRGFSMGGAACWQFAVHYPGLFAAAAPGAGFAETPEFLRTFQDEVLTPTWYERKLWHLYDCTDYALNLYNCPTVAYSGENDKQKQAADIMAAAVRGEQMELTHIIGPATAHSYHPDAKIEIDRRIDAIAARGRDRVPNRVRFCTYTLRYPEALWLRIEGLEHHWERARIDAEIIDARTINITTSNITALRLQMPSGSCPLDGTIRPTVRINGQELVGASIATDRSWVADFHRQADVWHSAARPDDGLLRKVPGLQGPIDDAFLDAFVMVRPTGTSPYAGNDRWVAAEMQHAISHWRRQFRGDARVKDDVDITEADIRDNNLILWGNESSNQILARIAGELPIHWQSDKLVVGKQSFAAGTTLPIMIYPNPLNPRRYVVLNSGFTFREYDYLNNARQVPKLPDWAVIDTNSPATSRLPGEIVAAGFFDERWQVPDDSRP